MNNEVREILIDLIADHGPTLTENPRRVEAFLKDLCGQHKPEIFVLANALKYGVVDGLLHKKDVPSEILLPQLSRQLEKDTAVTAEAADWAVESWALALGLNGHTKKRKPVKKKPVIQPVKPKPSGSDSRSPQLKSTRKKLKFENVDPRKKPTRQFTVSNSGQGKLSGAIESKVAWLSITPKQFECEPGQSVKIIVTLIDHPPAKKVDTPYALEIHTNSGSMTIRVTVTALAPPPLNSELIVSPAAIDFGEIEAGRRQNQKINILNPRSSSRNIKVSVAVPWLHVVTSTAPASPTNSTIEFVGVSHHVNTAVISININLSRAKLLAAIEKSASRTIELKKQSRRLRMFTVPKALIIEAGNETQFVDIQLTMMIEAIPKTQTIPVQSSTKETEPATFGFELAILAVILVVLGILAQGNTIIQTNSQLSGTLSVTAAKVVATSTPFDISPTPTPPTLTPKISKIGTPIITETAPVFEEPKAIPTVSLTGKTVSPGLALLNNENGQSNPSVFEWQFRGEKSPGAIFQLYIWRKNEKPLIVPLSEGDTDLYEKTGEYTYRLNRDLIDILPDAGVYYWTIVLGDLNAIEDEPLFRAETVQFNMTSCRLGGDQITLVQPLNRVSLDTTVFEWKTTAEIPSHCGFEIRVWKPGQQPLGVHDSVADNRDGKIERTGNYYRLAVNEMRFAPGIQEQPGQYLWTVVIVQIDSTYADTYEQAEPVVITLQE